MSRRVDPLLILDATILLSRKGIYVLVYIFFMARGRKRVGVRSSEAQTRKMQ